MDCSFVDWVALKRLFNSLIHVLQDFDDTSTTEAEMTRKIMDEFNRSYQSVFNHSFTESMTKYGGEQRSDSMNYTKKNQ